MIVQNHSCFELFLNLYTHSFVQYFWPQHVFGVYIVRFRGSICQLCHSIAIADFDRNIMRSSFAKKKELNYNKLIFCSPALTHSQWNTSVRLSVAIRRKNESTKRAEISMPFQFSNIMKLSRKKKIYLISQVFFTFNLLSARSCVVESYGC